MGGLRVELDNGKTAVTDPEGRFEFSGLRQDTYHVRLPLNQLNEAVRLTGPSDVAAPLLEGVAAEVNFGVVNFARLVGSVFNDYLLGADGVVSSASMPDLVGLTTPVCAALVCRFRNHGASVKLTSKTRRGYDDEEHPNVFDLRCRGSRNVYAGDGAATSHIHEGRRADPPAALPGLSPRRHDCADVVVDL